MLLDDLALALWGFHASALPSLYTRQMVFQQTPLSLTPEHRLYNMLCITHPERAKTLLPRAHLRSR